LVLKTDKVIVLIAEDELAKKYAQRAKLVTVDKISHVDGAVWQKAIEKKQGMVIEKDRKKMELINDRQESDYQIVDDVSDTIQDVEPTEKIILGKDGKQIEETPPESEPVQVVENTQENLKGKEEPKVEPMFKKLEPKLIDLGEFAIITGGDITKTALLPTLRNKLRNIRKIKQLDKKKQAELDQKRENDNGPSSGSGTPDSQQIQNETQPQPQPKTQDRSERIAEIETKNTRLKNNSQRHHLSPDQENRSEIDNTQYNKENIEGNTANVAGSADKRLSQERKSSIPSMNGGDLRQSKPPTTPHQSHKTKEESKQQTKTNVDRRANLTSFNFANGNKIPDRQNASSRFRSRSRGNSGGGFDLNLGGIELGSIQSKTSQLISNTRIYLKEHLFERGQSRNKIVGGAMGILLIFLLLSMFVFPSASIDLKVRSTSIPVQSEVTGSLAATTVDPENLTVPIRKVSKSETVNETGTATGTKQTGEKAKSTITIFNKSDRPVDIPAGTSLRLVNSNDLIYQVTADVTVPAQENSNSVPIAAESFGDQYNKADSSRKDFSFTSDDFSDLDAITYAQISGGNSEEVTAVTQEDIDTAVQQGTNVLTSALETELEDLISSSELTLQDQISFSEPQVESSVDAGAEADLFDVTITVAAEIYVVNKQDLVLIAEELAARNSQFAGDFNIQTLQDPEITNISLSSDGETANFELATQATASAQLDSDQVRGEVLGLSAGDAEQKLNELPDVESVELNYSPGYLPGFLRRLPADEQKVEVNLE
jgi:hypothetical protein